MTKEDRVYPPLITELMRKGSPSATIFMLNMLNIASNQRLI